MRASPFRVVVAFFAVVVLAGCATSSKRMVDLSVGMTKPQVISLLGTPDDVRASPGVELFKYKLATSRNITSCVVGTVFTLGLGAILCGEDTDEYFVRLVDGKVVEYGEGVYNEPGSRKR